MKREYEQRTRYYGMLDLALGTLRERAVQAHAAAAVQVSREGIRHSPLADEWFENLGGIAQGPWYHAARELRVPAPPGHRTDTPMARLARRIPAYYSGLLVSGADLNRASIVRSLIEQGLAAAHRRAWLRSPPQAEVASLLAHASVALARRSLDVAYFDEAVRQLSRVRALRQPLSADEDLLLATACAGRRSRWRLDQGVPARPAVTADWQRMLQPLVGYAQTSAPRTNRALALSSAAWFASLNGPELGEHAHRLFEQARELANGTPAQSCIESSATLFGGSGGPFRRELVEPCLIAEPL